MTKYTKSFAESLKEVREPKVVNEFKKQSNKKIKILYKKRRLGDLAMVIANNKKLNIGFNYSLTKSYSGMDCDKPQKDKWGYTSCLDSGHGWLESAMVRVPVHALSSKINYQFNNELDETVAIHVHKYFNLYDGQLPPKGVYQHILKQVEVPLIEIALVATDGNQAKCAEVLGINRNTLRKKIKDLDILVSHHRKLM